MTETALKRMFDRVPGRYDMVNRVVTLGLDQYWRRLAVRACIENQPQRVLDICTGTGDQALALAGAVADEVSVVAADFSALMLNETRNKAERLGLGQRIELVLADVSALPFNDGTFDAVGVGFGFRNLTFRNKNREKHLLEIARIVKPGGRFVIIESSQPASSLIRTGFRAYLGGWVKPMGGLLSGERGAYRYLAQSARDFYGPLEVKQMLLEAGFAEIRTTQLLGGATALHVATHSP